MNTKLYIIFKNNSAVSHLFHKVTSDQEGGVHLRSHAIARPMILAIMTSRVNWSVRFQWPLKYDTRNVFHPMIAQRI